MILYFADKFLNILGQASTGLPQGINITDDLKTDDVETGVAIFECDVNFTDSTRSKVEAWTENGNYILRSSGEESEFYTIIDTEIDTKKQKIHVYAEDNGLDLINEVAGPYDATQYYPISHYVNKYASGSGWEIGVNEVEGLTRKLSFSSDGTVNARLLSICKEFNNCEISFSFEISGLQITKKLINIYEKRGSDHGVQLRLNKEVDKIVTSKSISNLATALQCTGDTLDNSDTPVTLLGYQYDDGDFYVDGAVLKSRDALQKWNRNLWRNDNSQQAGGHIVKQYSYGTTSQEVLCTKAIEELKKLREMEVNYEITINSPKENIRVGDRVNIVDDRSGLYLSSRILILETSVANQKQSVILGDHIIKGSGISAKVAELAADFAKYSVSVKRALEIANNAKSLADNAKNTANSALTEAAKAQVVADEAKAVADTATKSAADATTKANNARAAVETVEKSVSSLETTVTNAQNAADYAHQAAVTAQTKADEAAQAAVNAQADAAEAKANVDAAVDKADTAIAKAEESITTANTAQANAATAQQTAAAAKQDAEKANADIIALGENLETVSNTMKADYARKTDLTEAQASLQTQINQNAGQIESTASRVQTIDETANNAQEKAVSAQIAAENAKEQADQATADAQAAQTAADNAATAAANAQSEADTAKAAAATAQGVADKAEADLAAAKADLATVSSRVGTTEQEIAAAQAAVETAQAAADKAKADVTKATEKADTAQQTADKAVTDASNAQIKANEASSQATIAQKLAEEAKGDAADAVTKANTAAETAAEAQRTADTAKTNASTAQTKANAAAQAAANAQQAANDADAKADQAVIDLAEAQQNLADVISRVDATVEEVEAAQQAVTTAQAAAEKAKQDAQAAQQTADTAKTNAENAQNAADNAKDAADAAQADADKALQDAAAAQAAVDSLAVRVTTAETKITQNSEEIELRATKSEVATSIAGIRVGSRNLLQSVFIKNGKDNSKEVTISCWASVFINHENLLQIIEPATEYTFSYTAELIEKTDVPTLFEYSVGFLIYSPSTPAANIWCNKSSLKVVGDKVYFEKTFTTPDSLPSDYKIICYTNRFTTNGAEPIGTDTVKFTGLKIEKGNKATDWTPAPEDVQADFATVTKKITDAESKITQNAEAIALRATKSEVTETLGGYYTKEQSEAAIKASADSVKSTVSTTYATKQEVKDIEIGGRNLILNSDKWTSVYGCAEGITATIDNGELEVVATATNSNWLSFWRSNVIEDNLKEGDDFTFSIEIKSDDGTIPPSIYYKAGNGYYGMTGAVSDQYSTVYHTGKWTKANDIAFHFGWSNAIGTYYIRKVKLEKGNKPTDWTPAPEDIIEATSEAQGTADSAIGKITTAESTIQQLSDSISMLVGTDENGASLVTQTATGWTFTTGDIKATAEKARDDLAELVAKYGSIESIISFLQTSIDDISSKTNYVNIGTYEDEPCIELGASNSEYKVLITNTQIMFQVGSNTPTRIDADGLVTENITVENELRQTNKTINGYFAWSVRANGNYGLMWRE